MLNLQEIPTAKTINMIVGWRQWADAGSISSGLPEYLINQTDARKIGEIKPDGFYLFQIPGTHHLLRPTIKLKDGRLQFVEHKKNEFYYAGDDERGLVIFIGDEPHMGISRYADAFFEAVSRLNVQRIAGLGGVYGPIPYQKDRQISCIFSLPRMKEELQGYAIDFSNYEGGASIGSLLVERAEQDNVEMVVFYGFVPAYDFAQSALNPQGVRIDNDYKAWFDLLQRLNHMMELALDLTDLQQQGEDLIAEMDRRLAELAEEKPQLNVKDFLAQLETNFTELSFVPLDDVWEEELRDIFGEDEEEKDEG